MNQELKELTPEQPLITPKTSGNPFRRVFAVVRAKLLDRTAKREAHKAFQESYSDRKPGPPFGKAF